MKILGVLYTHMIHVLVVWKVYFLFYFIIIIFLNLFTSLIHFLDSSTFLSWCMVEYFNPLPDKIVTKQGML